MPVAKLIALTFARSNLASVESLTVPEIVDLWLWLKAETHPIKQTSSARNVIKKVSPEGKGILEL